MRKLIPSGIFLCLLAALYFLYQRGGVSHADHPGISDPHQVCSVTVPAIENSEISYDISGFRRGDGYVLFLPTRTDMTGVVFYALDENGEVLERFVHDFTKSDFVMGGSIPVTAMSSPLPSVEISFSEGKGSLEKVEKSKDHDYWARGDMTVTCSDEEAQRLGCEVRMRSKNKDSGEKASMGLRGHGNASWLLDKKSYNISLEGEQSVLSMGNGRDYVLIANAIDRSLVRNQVFFEVAQDCGLKFTPQIRQVDLFIDGDYRGCYSLATRVEVGEGRVDITPDRDFFYRWGMPGEDAMPLLIDVFRDDLTNVVEVRDLKDDAQKTKAFVIAEDVMEAIADTGDDRYLSMVDLDSWARYYWVQEYSKNTDATSRSVYTWWDEDEGRMYMSPVWDMDQTAGVVEPFGRAEDYLYPTGWPVRGEEWYVPLFDHPEFADMVRQVYESGGVREALMKGSERAADASRAVRPSAEMNFVRWDVLGEEQNNQIVRWMGESTIDTEQEWLIEWLRQRYDWIEEQMDQGG